MRGALRLTAHIQNMRCKRSCSVLFKSVAALTAHNTLCEAINKTRHARYCFNKKPEGGGGRVRHMTYWKRKGMVGTSYAKACSNNSNLIVIISGAI